MTAEWSHEKVEYFSRKIAARSLELAAAGAVQEAPSEDMDPGERLAHMLATRAARRKAEEAIGQESNVIDARQRFKRER